MSDDQELKAEEQPRPPSKKRWRQTMTDELGPGDTYRRRFGGDVAQCGCRGVP